VYVGGDAYECVGSRREACQGIVKKEDIRQMEVRHVSELVIPNMNSKSKHFAEHRQPFRPHRPTKLL
jgi:hypothetical protein